MASQVFTFGYGGHSLDDLTELVMRTRSRLVDIRYNPMSSRKEFNLKELREAFGSTYLHLGNWGNVNYKSGPPIEIKDWDRGLQLINHIRGPVLLMCSCKDLEVCHRKLVAERYMRECGGIPMELSIRPLSPPREPSLFDNPSEFVGYETDVDEADELEHVA